MTSRARAPLTALLLVVGEQAGAQVGTVTFPITCRPAVQAEFVRGVALLHSFAYEASAAQFKSIARADSTCAMAYWGIAMSLLHPVWPPPEAGDLEAGRQAVERARALGSTSAREREYVAAIATYFDRYEETPYPARMLAYEAALERLSRRYPHDAEAAIFYALVLVANADPGDTTYARQRRFPSRQRARSAAPRRSRAVRGPSVMPGAATPQPRAAKFGASRRSSATASVRCRGSAGHR